MSSVHLHHISCTIPQPTNQPPLPPPQNKTKIEIRVCTNRTCRRQGSLQTLQTLLGLAPPHVSVNSCGCLGRCGAGPNVVVLPGPAMVSHCGTAARAARLIVDSCGGGGDNDGDSDGVVRRSLDALALRNRAEMEMEKGNFSEAEALFTQVIEAQPIGGVHVAYKGRSIVRLAAGNYDGALEDAKEALALCPKYAEAYICQGDAFLDMDQLEAAEKSYTMALESDPSVHRSKSFKARKKKLEEKMISKLMP